MIIFPKYAKIKNNYCVAYLGLCNEYLLLLDYFIPKLESIHTGINIYLCCRDECTSLSRNSKIIPISLLKDKKEELIHIKEIVCDGKIHPIELFLTESGLNDFAIQTTEQPVTAKSVIVTKSNFPTTNLTEQESAWLAKKAADEGFYVEYDTNVNDAGFVLGVESQSLYQAAMLGIKTFIVPKGVGTGFFKKLFPINSYIMDIPGYISKKTVR